MPLCSRCKAEAEVQPGTDGPDPWKPPEWWHLWVTMTLVVLSIITTYNSIILL